MSLSITYIGRFGFVILDHKCFFVSTNSILCMLWLGPRNIWWRIEYSHMVSLFGYRYSPFPWEGCGKLGIRCMNKYDECHVRVRLLVWSIDLARPCSKQIAECYGVLTIASLYQLSMFMNWFLRWFANVHMNSKTLFVLCGANVFDIACISTR